MLVGYCGVGRIDMILDRQVDALEKVFKRDLLSERTKERLKAAKVRGRSGGHPSKHTEKKLTVRILYESGVTITQITG